MGHFGMNMLASERPEVDPVLTDAVAAFGETVDPFSRVKSISRFTGSGDAIADMQLAYDVLDAEADPAPTIAKVLSLARKMVVFRMGLTAERTEDFWRSQLSERVHIIKWDTDGKRIAVTGIPKVGIQGITAQGVLSSEDRWGQVQASMARVSKRIEISEPHGRTAIIACYGPSLRNNIRCLEDERWEIGASIVVSVSGAHDFLINHGVIPDYHVECDPRSHKADNIVRAHGDVTYLIGSCAHPVLFDKLDGADVRLWHVATPGHGPRFLRETKENPQHVISGGGSVGLRSIPLLYAMGYRDFSIYGMDCSFADEGKTQWAGKHAGKEQDVISAICGGRTFHTSPVLLTYATDFIEMVQKVSDAQFRIYGDSLLHAMCVAHAQTAEGAN
jgi:hypothetical protein